jgi:hypothetical protein
LESGFSRLLLLLFLVSLAVVDVIADVDAPCTRLVLLNEFDTAGHTDALEIPLLLSSDVVIADAELDECPHTGDSVGKGGNTYVWTIKQA